MYYLEHRVYLVACASKPEMGPTGPLDLELPEVGKGGAKYRVSVARIPAPGDEWPEGEAPEVCLDIRLGDEALRQFADRFGAVEGATFQSVRLILTDLGFLHIYSVFSLPDATTPDNTETVSWDILFAHNKHFSFYVALCKALGSMKLIVPSTVYHFGTNRVLSLVGECDPSASYMVDSHFFVSDASLRNRWVDVLNLANRPFKVGTWAVHPGRACHLWLGPGPLDPDDSIANLISFKHVLELCLTHETAVTCYTGFLNLVRNQPAKVNPALVNQIVAANNFILQKLSLEASGFYEAPFAIVEELKQRAKFRARIDLFRDSERALTSAVAGIHAWALRKASKAIRFLLNSFAVLSLYSIAYSVICLLNIDEIPRPHLGTSAGYAFVAISMLVAVAVLYSALTVYKSEDAHL